MSNFDSLVRGATATPSTKVLGYPRQGVEPSISDVFNSMKDPSWQVHHSSNLLDGKEILTTNIPPASHTAEQMWDGKAKVERVVQEAGNGRTLRVETFSVPIFGLEGKRLLSLPEYMPMFINRAERDPNEQRNHVVDLPLLNHMLASGRKYREEELHRMAGNMRKKISEFDQELQNRNRKNPAENRIYASTVEEFLANWDFLGYMQSSEYPRANVAQLIGIVNFGLLNQFPCLWPGAPVGSTGHFCVKGVNRKGQIIDPTTGEQTSPDSELVSTFLQVVPIWSPPQREPSSDPNAPFFRTRGYINTNERTVFETPVGKPMVDDFDWPTSQGSDDEKTLTIMHWPRTERVGHTYHGGTIQHVLGSKGIHPRDILDATTSLNSFIRLREKGRIGLSLQMPTRQRGIFTPIACDTYEVYSRSPLEILVN